MTVKEFLKEYISDIKSMTTSQNISDVHLEGNPKIREFIEKMIIDKLMLPNSNFLNVENIVDLYQKSLSGHSCLILCEHPSNLDLPIFFSLAKKTLEQNETTKPIAEEFLDKIIAIASIKVSDSDIDDIGMLSSGFEKIVIYPSRVIDSLVKDPAVWESEKQKSRHINHKAIKLLTELKHKGKIIFLFPAGTRKKEWDPDTLRILPESASYVKLFNYFVPIAISGKLLNIRQDNEGGALGDEVMQDTVIMNAGKVTESKKFLTMFDSFDGEEKKQEIAQEIYKIFNELNKVATDYKNSGI